MLLPAAAAALMAATSGCPRAGRAYRPTGWKRHWQYTKTSTTLSSEYAHELPASRNIPNITEDLT